MRIFLTGTGTDVGKTVISTWLCLHSRYSYFKPIQTGNLVSKDNIIVQNLAAVNVFKESFSFTQPFSPHLAAKLDKSYIDEKNIVLPNEENLIIEGAGGIMVPINDEVLIIDLIEQLQVPVILVAQTMLGTINHTLLSLEAMKRRNIEVLGTILNGEPNEENRKAIEFYGGFPVLATFPKLKNLSHDSVKAIELSSQLKNILKH